MLISASQNALALPPAMADAGERLSELRSRVPGRITFTTSFGIEDQAITHFIFSRDLAIDVVTLDTGRLFPSTYALWEQTEQKYGRRVRSVHPTADGVAEMVADAGINGFYYSKDARLACCHVRKVEPLKRALAGAEAWVTGLRADQSGQRAAVAMESWDEERQLIKFAPLFDWTRARVAEFCSSEHVPVNVLHADGFVSIGCQPCTRAIAPGEPERAGRWWWEDQGNAECGLHVGPNGKLARGKTA
jgi:phosphoadenosine phosphosulfate reductase